VDHVTGNVRQMLAERSCFQIDEGNAGSIELQGFGLGEHLL
jgi:hypothetical protein